MIFTGGQIAKRCQSPVSRNRKPPGKSFFGPSLWFLDTAVRPPIPAKLEDEWRLKKTWNDLDSILLFWLTLLRPVVTGNRHSMQIECDHGEDRHGVIIKTAEFDPYEDVKLMTGIICEPGDDDAADVAALEAWSDDWGEKRPGMQCWFFVINDRVKFYVYSKIDESFAPERSDPHDVRFQPERSYTLWAELP